MLNRPDVVHTSSPKGFAYGGVAARLLRVPVLVVSISGRGSLFTSEATFKIRVLRTLYLFVLRFVLGHSGAWAVVENEEDQQWIGTTIGVDSSRIVRTFGAGVELEPFAAVAPVTNQRTVVLPARLMRDKGVVEFATAARILRERGYDWTFALVGTADYENSTAVSARQLKAWQSEGVVEWWGYQAAMEDVYAKAAIVCLPSYGEGMPKVLLEAAAAGRPVVTTDVVGCREAIVEGQTGLLVPARNAESLADALAALIDDPEKRMRFGEAGRALAIEKFDVSRVVARICEIYEQAWQVGVARRSWTRVH
jgi:glycosyltransferase involved in cell wall biosynthesis